MRFNAPASLNTEVEILKQQIHKLQDNIYGVSNALSVTTNT